MKRTLILAVTLALVSASHSLTAGEKTTEAKEEGFIALQNGDKPADGWVKGVVVQDGCLAGDGRYMKREFGDFILRFDFKLKPGSNSGIGIRTDKEGNAAYRGMEIQVLENTAKQYANLQPYQYHGSVYGVAPAKRGHLKPVGEWNTEEISAKGSHIKVTLNGVVIVDVDLKEVAKDGTLDKRNHPGLFNKKGYISLCGHGGGVLFRNMRIKPLD